VLIAAISANETRSAVFAQLLESRLIEHLMGQKNVETIAAAALVSAQELELPAGVLGRKLNCSLVAVGRVETVNQSVRCVLQLIASDSGSVVWMKSFSGRQRDFGNALPELLEGIEATIFSRPGTHSEQLRTAA
jgi:TolB-like protein